MKTRTEPSFDNFFKSPSPFANLFDKDVHTVRVTRKNRKDMAEMTAEKNMKQGDNEFLLSEKINCSKWFDNQSFTMLFSNVKGVATISTVL